MLRQQVGTAADRPPADAVEPAPQRTRDIDAVHVRNYDHRAGHSVQITLADAEGHARLSERRYLAPGQSRRLTGALEPGGYELRVRVDGVDRRVTRCRVDASPDRTAVVELGNGVVSVTEGADGLVTAD